MSIPRVFRIPRPVCHACVQGTTTFRIFPRSSWPATAAAPTTARPTNKNFTTSTARQAYVAKSPAARRRRKGYGIMTGGKYIGKDEYWESFNEVKTAFESSYKQWYADFQKQNMLDRKISEKVFYEIGSRLIRHSYNSDPTAETIKSIWTGDPQVISDTAEAICLGCSAGSKWLFSWSLEALSQVGHVNSLVRRVYAQIRVSGKIYDSREVMMLKQIAYEKDDPFALIAWAQIARDWGQTEEAIDIYEHLNKVTYPSNLRPRWSEDLLFKNRYKPPWKSLFEMYNEAGRYNEADKMMETGALIYRDPSALISYAYLQKEKGNWEAYEQCLVAAAVSGNGEACFRLGNYYYRIYQGDIPSRDEIAAKKHPIRAWIAKLFGSSFIKEDWRRLALDWYEMASVHGYLPGTRNFVVLLREDGHPEAKEVLQQIQQDHAMWQSSNIVKLRNSFDDPNFKPKLPKSWLEL